ncbi:uncharacterized protein G2W53_008081 [Senna tora]|uniref:Uncharacterized protein n=1 Tax=Senna tora TaxID=362788 RepID=A0A834X8P0_9FABA|nr:uncharacterized protein G2W53_008081 [Senna tora]
MDTLDALFTDPLCMEYLNLLFGGETIKEMLDSARLLPIMEKGPSKARKRKKSRYWKRTRKKKIGPPCTKEPLQPDKEKEAMKAAEPSPDPLNDESFKLEWLFANDLLLTESSNKKFNPHHKASLITSSCTPDHIIVNISESVGEGQSDALVATSIKILNRICPKLATVSSVASETTRHRGKVNVNQNVRYNE